MMNNQSNIKTQLINEQDGLKATFQQEKNIFLDFINYQKIIQTLAL